MPGKHLCLLPSPGAVDGSWVANATCKLLLRHAAHQQASRLLEAARHGDAHGIAALVAQGVDMDATASEGGHTALMEAASNGSWAAAKALLEAGADAMHQDSEGRNALMLAAQGGHAALTAELLAAGVPWNALDARGECAGDYAAAAGQAATAELLLEAGAPGHGSCLY